ncbi:MAG TPA: metal ABC transporter permease [Candidatus Eisenbacteria bacterium]|nr:metal ABC transporter permease [Candidatus Eisenbacteria bacterium]
MPDVFLVKLSDYLSYNNQILLTLVITGTACAVLGCFLLLRQLSMVTDALSHTILLGIVLAYFITKDLNSPLLFIGAGLFGVFTVFSIELLSATRLVKNDDAVGIIFPLFFSLAVILISTFARDVHLDVDMVLMGQVVMIPLNLVNFGGFMVPKAMIYMTLMLVLNSAFIIVFFKELKASTFDPEFATLAGFSSTLLYYLLMTLTSFTAVSAFDAVGAIMVIALFIGPAASAYLVTKDLKKMVIVSALYAILNAVAGYYLSMSLNVSISGLVATMTGLTTLLTVLFNRQGVVTSIYNSYKNRKEFHLDMMIIHIGNHHELEDEVEELGFDTIKDHLNWKQDAVDSRASRLLEQGLIKRDDALQVYRLTNQGKSRYDIIKSDYNI